MVGGVSLGLGPNFPSAGRDTLVLEVIEDWESEELAHPVWIRGRRRRVEASLRVDPNHLLPVVVSAVHREWADVEGLGIEARPGRVAEVCDREDV